MKNNLFNKLSIPDQADLIRLYIKNGIYDLNQMKEHFYNFINTNENNLFATGSKINTKGDNPPAQFEYTPKDYSYLFSRDYQLQQQAEQTKRQQDNTRVANQPKVELTKQQNESAKDRFYKNKLKQQKDKNLITKIKDFTSAIEENTKRPYEELKHTVGRTLTAKGLEFENSKHYPGFQPFINGFLNKDHGRYNGMGGKGGYGLIDIFYGNDNVSGFQKIADDNLLPQYDDYIKTHYPNKKVPTYTYHDYALYNRDTSKPFYTFEPDASESKSYNMTLSPRTRNEKPLYLQSGGDYSDYYMDDNGKIYIRKRDIYKFHPKDFYKKWINNKDYDANMLKQIGKTIGVSAIDYTGNPFIYTSDWDLIPENNRKSYYISDSTAKKLKEKYNKRIANNLDLFKFKL